MKQRSVKKDNTFLFIALFAVLLAGDVVWWEMRQLGDDFENSAALMQGVVHRKLPPPTIIPTPDTSDGIETSEEIE